MSAVEPVEPIEQIRAERDALLKWAGWVEEGLAIHECSDPGCRTLRDIRAHTKLVLDDIRLRRNDA
jgi:hypothetical protein